MQNKGKIIIESKIKEKNSNRKKNTIEISKLYEQLVYRYDKKNLLKRKSKYQSMDNDEKNYDRWAVQ